jgi:hypothetical protein
MQPGLADFGFICFYLPVGAGILGLLLVKRRPWVALAAGCAGVVLGIPMIFVTLSFNVPLRFLPVPFLPFGLGVACLIRWARVTKEKKGTDHRWSL